MPIRQALDDLARQSGIPILIQPDVTLGPDGAERRVTLRMQQVPLHAALEWLGRSLDAYYQVVAEEGVWFVPNDLWMGEEKRVGHSYYLDPVLAPGAVVWREKQVRGQGAEMTTVTVKSSAARVIAQRRRQVIALVRHLLRRVERLQPNSRFLFIERTGTLWASCPPSAHRKIQAILGQIRLGNRPSRPIEIPPSPPGPPLPAALVAKLECDYRRQPVTKILDSLARRSRINIGLDPKLFRPPPEQPPQVGLSLGKVSLRRALNELVYRARLGSYRIEPGRGVWLHPGAPPEPREILWDRAYVRSFHVTSLLRRLAPKKLLQLVRENITPQAWKEDLPAMGLSPEGRLVVLHSPEALARIERHLQMLAQIQGLLAPAR